MDALAKNGLKTSSKKTKKILPASPPKAAVAKKSSVASFAGSLLGKKAPNFKCHATSGKLISSSDLSGKPWVLYFYPKDHTPGCTVEGQDFKKRFAKFRALDCEIFGVSKDSLKRHESFKEKFGFPFELIEDESEVLCRKYDVIHSKKLYGREYEGIERSTFLVDAKGIVCAEWRRVKVAGHVDQVLKALSEINT